MTELNTVDRARGRSRQILPQLGIDTQFLINKHGPCPLCGGVDRFRFDDKDGSGSYYCNQCGPGVGLILVRKRNNLDYGAACREVDKILGDSVDEVDPAQVSSIKPAEQRESAIKKL